MTRMGPIALGLALAAAPTWAQTELSMWYHGAGNPTESELIERIVREFNEAQDDWEVSLESFPQTAYNDSVVAAALAGDLPDILDVDGPVMPNWAWSGYLQPLPIDEAAVEGFLPGALGRWDGELYTVGLWDAAVALMTRRSYLEGNGIRVPTLEEPWTQEEFDAALETLQATGQFEHALDLGMADQGEWYPYAFAPWLWSFGGSIVDREGYQTAEGSLNGEEAIAFGEWWASLFERDLAPGPSQSMADREQGFQDGRYAMSWNGNWNAVKMLEAFDDVLFLPAPDFGEGPRIGAASWQFGASASTEHPEGVAAFVEHAIQPQYLAAFSDGIGLIPPTEEAAAQTELYAEGAPLEVFYELSEAQAMLRPVTPGYVVAAKVFQKALTDIADGADPASTLDAAVDEIDADIERNQGYGHES